MNKQKFSLLFIYLAVFINGGLILVIEIAGAKILTPYFGGTLHVWGAMISVTLAALAIGYFAGGKLADKVGKTAMLPSAIIVGSMLAVLGTIFSKHILDWTKDFSLEMGTLVSSVIIFIPSLIVLATVSPMGIKLILRNFEKVGSTSGTVFAISTIGSVLGAIIAAFYLIPWL